MSAEEENKHSLYHVKLPFSFKLYEMLEDSAANGQAHIVSWQPHGKAFRVHQPREFAASIMPRYFKQTKYKSFQRQVLIYGFHRIVRKGLRDKGAYYHERFLRGQKQATLKMIRQKIKGPEHAYETNRECDPDFYAGTESTPSTTSYDGSSPCAPSPAAPTPGRSTVTDEEELSTRIAVGNTQFLSSNNQVMERIMLTPAVLNTNILPPPFSEIQVYPHGSSISKNLEDWVCQAEKVVSTSNNQTINSFISYNTQERSWSRSLTRRRMESLPLDEKDEAYFFEGKRFFAVVAEESGRPP